jgi:hypothetical protein
LKVEEVETLKLSNLSGCEDETLKEGDGGDFYNASSVEGSFHDERITPCLLEI